MLLKQQGRALIKNHSPWRKLFRYCFFLIIFNGLFTNSNSLNAAVDVEIPLYQLHHQVMEHSLPAWLSSYQGRLNFLILGLVAININKLFLDSDDELPESDEADPEVDSISQFSVVACRLKPSSDQSSDRLNTQPWRVKRAAGDKDKETEPQTGQSTTEDENKGPQHQSTQTTSGRVAGATGGSDGGGDEPPEGGPGKEKFSDDPPIPPLKDDENNDDEKLSTELTNLIMYGNQDNETLSAIPQDFCMAILNMPEKLKSLTSQQKKELSAISTNINHEIEKLENELRQEIEKLGRNSRQEIEELGRTLRHETAELGKTLRDRIKVLEKQTGTTRAKIAGSIQINGQLIQNTRTRLEAVEKRADEFENGLQDLLNGLQANGVTIERFYELPNEFAALQMQVTENQEGIRDQAAALEAGNNEVAQLRARVTILEDELRRLQLGANSALYAQQFNGTLIFPIFNFQRRRQESISGQVGAIFSNPFWTSLQGYKLDARIYLNGDEGAKGRYISMFIALLKGNHDSRLRWPFPLSITLVAFNQEDGEHVIRPFVNIDPNTRALERPQENTNRGLGFSEFFSLELLNDPGYVKGNVMYFGVFIR